ncbi:MAG: winged helix-turn-helix transcriptional regulator [Gemmatimonadaceae bacterium]
MRGKERSITHYACPVELTLDVIGGKWKPLILWELRAGPRRYNTLLHTVGVSHKVLTQQLRALERRDIIVRTARERGERHVEYRLSEFGRTLRPVLNSMAGWAKRNQGRLGARVGVTEVT